MTTVLIILLYLIQIPIARQWNVYHPGWNHRLREIKIYPHDFLPTLAPRVEYGNPGSYLAFRTAVPAKVKMFSPHVVNSTESSIFQVAKWILDFTAAQIYSKFWNLRCRLYIHFLTNKVVVQPISIHQIAEVHIWVQAVHFDTNLTSKIFLNPYLAKKILRYQKFIDSL